jgi:acyl carrier protein
MIITATDIFADLHEVSEQLDIDLEGIEISASVSLEDDLGMDSLGMMDFLVFLERKYLVTIPNDLLNDVSTVGDIAGILNEMRLAEAGAAGIPMPTRAGNTAGAEV